MRAGRGLGRLTLRCSDVSQSILFPNCRRMDGPTVNGQNMILDVEFNNSLTSHD